jgi:iron complex transport system substrate-binding protein
VTRTGVSALLCLASLSAWGLDGPTYLGPKPPPSPQRVVTLAPSLTECVVALGASSRLVGVTRFDELPEVAAVARVGGFSDPSIEAVLALKPELVLVQPGPGNREPVDKLAHLGVPILALPLDTVAHVEGALGEIGRALGLPSQGEALAAELRATRVAVRRRAAGLPRLRVLFVYGFEPLVVAGPGSFAHELLQDAGAINVVEKAASAYPVYTPEAAVAARPDIIIDAADAKNGSEALFRLAQRRATRWVALPSKDLLHPGPRLGHGLEELFWLLHGGGDAGR